MRLQSFGVIFVVIIVPLILVLSYYLNLQIKTITKQNEYDNDLLSATYDAMSSFEINTANEDLSTVSDSLRTIIEASCNVFTNSLATNLGMSNASKSYLEPFVPAVLYTLYDGYYIYAPTKVPTIVTDSSGNAVTVGDPGVSVSGSIYTYDPGGENKLKYSDLNNKNDFGQQLYIYEEDVNHPAHKNGDSSLPCTTKVSYQKDETPHTQMKIKNVLKTYMPYSAKYKQGDINITIVYTLDNFVTIEGNIGNVYYTKSGYLVPLKDAEGNEIISAQIYNPDGTACDSTKVSIFNYNQADAKKYIADGNRIDLTLKYSKEKDGALVSDSACTIRVGHDPIKLTKIEGDFTFEEDVTYLYRDPKDVTDSATPYDAAKDIVGYTYVSGESKEISSMYNYYNYSELERRITKLRAAYEEADNFINRRKKDPSSYHYTSDEEYVKYLENNKKDGLVEGGTDPEIEQNLEDFKVRIISMINNRQYILDEASAVQYYVESYIFSKWINDTLGNLKESSIVDIAGIASYTSINGTDDVLYEFLKRGESNVFDLSPAKESLYEITSDSPFYTHKTNVIRNSIQYNLNMAMSTYNNITASTYEYQMPVLNAEEWEKILTNVSIVSFMQGYSCGLKTYNNYKIVTSSNNEITVNPEDIYYIKRADFNDETTKYHKIDCEELYDQCDSKEYISFRSKEAKYDKLYNKNDKNYKYDHRNLACYFCVNDKNYDRKRVFDTADTDVNKNLQYAYYVGVGKERNNLYKMNAFLNSQGYEILYINGNTLNNNTIGNNSSLPVNKMKSMQITILPLKFVGGTAESVVNVEVFHKNSSQMVRLSEKDNSFYTINYSSTVSTFNIDINPNIKDPDTTNYQSILFYNKRKDSNLADITGTAISEEEEEPNPQTESKDITQTMHTYTLSVKVIYK